MHPVHVSLNVSLERVLEGKHLNSGLPKHAQNRRTCNFCETILLLKVIIAIPLTSFESDRFFLVYRKKKVYCDIFCRKSYLVF